MSAKAQLIAKILNELRKAQAEEWIPPQSGRHNRLIIPPNLPVGDGLQISVTDTLLRAVADFANLWLENDPSLKSRFKIEEFRRLANEAFGKALSLIDLGNDDEKLRHEIAYLVAEDLKNQIARYHRPVDLTLGCHLLDGDDAYPVHIGPVVFETREQWRQRMIAANRISPTTARRLKVHWEGKPLRKRMGSNDQLAEQAIAGAIGENPIVCVVETDGLSGNYVQEKGLLAARLAMTALSLMWTRPSEGLSWMNLLYDRRVSHQRAAHMGSGRFVGAHSTRAQMPVGRWTDAEFIKDLRANQWMFDQVGEALCTYVQPTRDNPRPKLMNALFLSLWWYHEACREPLDQIATTKFAASMDSLVPGQSAGSIVQFIGARIGFKPEDALMADGRTTKAVIAKIYEASRSRLIHGSSVDFAHDWSQVRKTAEVVGRDCLVEACRWLSANSNSDELKLMSQP